MTKGIERLYQSGIVAIMRNIPEKCAVDVVQALYDGGIRVVEVTMNTIGAANMIADIANRFADKMWVGAGTVIGLPSAQAAQAAGARFFITPNTDEKVIAFGLHNEIPVITGALTPTEIVRAHRAGSAMVKVFPCGSMGAGYIAELRGPLSHIPLMAVGGITLDNAADFRKAGAAALGIGGSLIQAEDVAAGCYEAITKRSVSYLKAFEGR